MYVVASGAFLIYGNGISTGRPIILSKRSECLIGRKQTNKGSLKP